MKKETEEWLKIAIEDFLSAKHLFVHSLFRMVCYHSQQSVEKLSKAILLEHDIDIPRTHNLFDLNNAVRKLGYSSPLSDEDAVFLNSIYRSQYPFDSGLLSYGEPTNKDAEKALEIAKKMMIWFKEKCKF